MKRWPPILAASLGTIVLVAHAWWTRDWTVDDVFITLRYARNLADGLGPVFNAGEAVEGYTCPLWVFLLSILGRLGVDLYDGARALGLAFSIGTVWLVAFSTRFDERTLPVPAAAAGSILTATTLPFVQWSATGMENPMFAFFVTWMVLAYLAHLREPSRERASAVVVAAALCLLTRPDAIVFVAVLGVHRIVRDAHEGTRWSGWFAAGLLCTYGSYFVWRWTYYGHLLPNTFYAKVGQSSDQLFRGLAYVLQGCSVSFVVLGPFVVWSLLRVRASAPLFVPLAAVAVHLAFVAAMGGDHFAAFRFFAVIVPLAATGTGVAIHRASTSPQRGVFALVVLVGLNLVSLRSHPDYKEIHSRKGWVARSGRAVGTWLHESVPEDTVLATNAAGALAYYSELRIIDMLGLVDEHIAHVEIDSMGTGKPGHEKGDGAYVFTREPDYVMFASSVGAEKPMFRGDRELSRQKGWKRLYDLETFDVPGAGKVKIYRRKGSPPIEPPPTR